MTNTGDALEITKRLEQVNGSFVCLGCRVTKEAVYAKQVTSRLTVGMVTMVKLVKVWKNRSIGTVLN